MKKFYPLVISSLLTLIGLSPLAYGQVAPTPTPPSTQGGGNTYAGYSQNYLQANDVTPYGIISAHDVYPLVTGYGLMQMPQTPGFDPNNPGDYLKNYDTPYITNSLTTPSTQAKPNAFGRTPTEILIGSMMFNLTNNQITAYLTQADSAFQPAPLTSGTSFNNNSIGNTPHGTTFDYMISDQFAAPYNAASLFQYVPASKTDSSGSKSNVLSAYAKNPAEVYMALVSGALTPVAFPDNPTSDFMMRLRRLIANQTAGVYALQNIFARTQPLNHFDANILKQINSNFPDASKAAPTNARELEKFMATRRLDPASGWYQHLQAASPTELQREQLYLEAEMLYELQQIHESEEQNQLLLAVNLLSQNYTSRVTLNQAQQLMNS